MKHQIKMNEDNSLNIIGTEGFETYPIDQNTVGVRPKWISVEERLPEEGDIVLTCRKNVVRTPYRIDYIVLYSDMEKGYIWGCTLEDEWETVTHWMPLPSLPNTYQNCLPEKNEEG